MKRLVATALLLIGVAEAKDCQGKQIKHDLGETCIEGIPKRVVALEWNYAEDVLALGIQPVGVADISGYQNWVDIPVKFNDSVQDVGTRQQPSLEKIRLLKPDLIITSKLRSANNYKQLQSLAPTIAFDMYSGSSQYEEMRNAFTKIGTALNKDAEAKKILGDLDVHLNKTKQQLSKAGHSGERFVFAQAYTSKSVPAIRIFTKNSMVSEILTRVNLKNAWPDKDQPYGFTTVGLEALTTLKTNHFMYVTQTKDAVFAAPSVQPLWKGLPFVKSGNAYPLSERTWTFGGPLSARTLLDQISQKLLSK